MGSYVTCALIAGVITPSMTKERDTRTIRFISTICKVWFEILNGGSNLEDTELVNIKMDIRELKCKGMDWIKQVLDMLHTGGISEDRNRTSVFIKGKYLLDDLTTTKHPRHPVELVS
jgi:hypothetical protein